MKILRVVILWNVVYYIYGILKLILNKQTWSFSIGELFLQIIKSLVQDGACWHFWYMGSLALIYFLIPFI